MEEPATKDDIVGLAEAIASIIETLTELKDGSLDLSGKMGDRFDTVDGNIEDIKSQLAHLQTLKEPF